MALRFDSANCHSLQAILTKHEYSQIVHTEWKIIIIYKRLVQSCVKRRETQAGVVTSESAISIRDRCVWYAVHLHTI